MTLPVASHKQQGYFHIGGFPWFSSGFGVFRELPPHPIAIGLPAALKRGVNEWTAFFVALVGNTLIFGGVGPTPVQLRDGIPAALT